MKNSKEHKRGQVPIQALLCLYYLVGWTTQLACVRGATSDWVEQVLEIFSGFCLFVCLGFSNTPLMYFSHYGFLFWSPLTHGLFYKPLNRDHSVHVFENLAGYSCHSARAHILRLMKGGLSSLAVFRLIVMWWKWMKIYPYAAWSRLCHLNSLELFWY